MNIKKIIRKSIPFFFGLFLAFFIAHLMISDSIATAFEVTKLAPETVQYFQKDSTQSSIWWDSVW